MNCKVIYGFDPSLSKRFSISFFFLRVQIDLSRDLLWFGVSPKGFGKDH